LQFIIWNFVLDYKMWWEHWRLVLWSLEIKYDCGRKDLHFQCIRTLIKKIKKVWNYAMSVLSNENKWECLVPMSSIYNRICSICHSSLIPFPPPTKINIKKQCCHWLNHWLSHWLKIPLLCYIWLNFYLQASAISKWSRA